MHSKSTMQQAEQNRIAIGALVVERWKKKRATAWTDIVGLLNIPKGSMPRLLQELQREKIIACIGTARDAGRNDLRASYKVYAPFGTPPLAKVEPPRRRVLTLTAPVVKREKYKGVVAPKHYHDWRTPELTVEAYDIYAGRNLAMLAR